MVDLLSEDGRILAECFEYNPNEWPGKYDK